MSETEWQAAARSGDMVAAIKLYRLANGVNLADAKRAVETWADADLPMSSEYAAAVRTCERVDARLADYPARGSSPAIAYMIGIIGGPPGWSCLHKLVTGIDSDGLDLAVEVVVPGTSTAGRSRAIKDHLAAGVTMVWYLDAEDVSVRVATEPTRWSIYHDEFVFDGGDVLPGFTCKVADLFA